MRKKIISGLIGLLCIALLSVLANAFLFNSSKFSENSQDLASGRMHGSGSSRSARSSGSHALPPIQRSRGTHNFYPYPAQPFHPPSIYNEPHNYPNYPYMVPEYEEEEEEEEPPVEINELPSFTLKNETPHVHIGETITIKVLTIEAKEPVTIFWHFNDEDEWTIGGKTYQRPAMKQGTISISVVVQDAEGLYSQVQSTTTTIDPIPSTPQNKVYQEQMGSGPDKTQKQEPEKKSDKKRNNKTDEEEILELLGVDSVLKQQRLRLIVDLMEATAKASNLEMQLQEDKKGRAILESKLEKILIARPIGQNTPSIDELIVSDNLYQINQLIKSDEKRWLEAKEKVSELTKALKQ